MHLQQEISNALVQSSNLIEKEIPDQTQNLSNNVKNLKTVAEYCEDQYVNSKESNKVHLLNETRGYTSQALASVAYQIHELANSFLQLLENQSLIINDMSVSMSHLAHDVSIHKEKVARREIGVLTTNKCVMRTQKIKRPEVDEKQVKYVRKQIDYSILDDIGHGVKLNRQSSALDPLAKIGVGRQNSYSSTHSSSSLTNVSKPESSPLIGPGNGHGTVRGQSGNSYYRTPVAPPSVPSEYLSRQELGIYSSKKELSQGNNSYSESTYATGAYGGPLGYRRPSQTSNNPNNLTLQNNSYNQSEYSDTIGRTNNYLQDLNNYSTSSNLIGLMGPGLHGIPSIMANQDVSMNSVGYATGKDANIIRTNLNNIDYAATGTLYRRPQLHPSIYEPKLNESNQLNRGSNNPHQQQLQHAQIYNTPRSLPNYNSGLGFNNDHGILPPPPTNLLSRGSGQPDRLNLDNNSDIQKIDFLDDDDDIIPNWVPLDRCLEKVVTIFDYERTRDDELSFKENTVIFVIKKNDDLWYEGIMKDDEDNVFRGIIYLLCIIELRKFNLISFFFQGLFPYNYVRCIRKYAEEARVTQC
jgi:abl interactor 2